MPTFRTKLKHNTSTVIEVFGEFFTFTGGIGLLTTETPAVVERLRAIPEGFEELGGQADYRQRAILPPAPVAAPAVEEAPPPVPADQPAPVPAPVDSPEPNPAPAPAPIEGPQTSAADAAADPRPFVLRNEAGAELDLALLDDDQLRAFVVDNGLKVNGKAKGDILRKAIYTALQPDPAA